MSIVVSTAATTGPSPMKKKKREGSGHWLATIVRHILFLHRRRQLFPLISAASGCLLLLFVAFSIFSTPPAIHHLQRHPPLNHKLAVESNFDLYASFHVPESGGSLGRELWTSRESKFYFGCCSASNTFQTADVKTHPNRYLLIATSGGLNQQRTGITDAVVAAYILNATLVIPTLDHKSYWKDSSDFEEIFDVDWFISFLSRDVKVIKEIPSSPGKISHMRVPRKCNPKCYESRVLPVLKKKHAVQLTKYDYRLSNKLDDELQKLRCRVNYHALKFTDSLNKMGKTLVERMRMKAKHYIALHLRFEPDMLAFSGCYYGGGDKEREELGEIRKRWKTLHVSNPDKVRRRGKCPLTPQEIGLMLRALGFGSDVHLYVASGEVYGGEATLAPLKELFPNFHSKETLTSKKELKLFSSFSSRMAALDFMVCDESDVFVTNNNGNMARILAGRRRYFGHKPTIRPNAKKISRLLMDRNNMTWEEFASRVRTHQIGFMGEPNEVKAGRGEFHENPTSCICESPLLKARNQSLEHRKMGEKHKQTKDIGNVANDQLPEDDPDWPDDYEDNSHEGEELPVEPHLTQSLSVKPEHPDMDDMFSD